MNALCQLFAAGIDRQDLIGLRYDTPHVFIFKASQRVTSRIASPIQPSLSFNQSLPLPSAGESSWNSSRKISTHQTPGFHNSPPPPRSNRNVLHSRASTNHHAPPILLWPSHARVPNPQAACRCRGLLHRPILHHLCH